MKKYKLRYTPLDDDLLPWSVEQWYPWSLKKKLTGRWCLIARFYSRSGGRLFLRTLRKEQRDPHFELIPACMKKQKEIPLWPSSAKLQEIGQSLANARRMQGWT